MSRYAHWLDGEFLLLRSLGQGQSSESVDAECARYLKFLAIMGESLDLSDIQVIDSFSLLRQFSDPGFVAFLRANPWFLRLVSRASDEHSTTHELVLRGFERAQHPLWRSSAFPDPNITHILGEVLDRKPRLPEALRDPLVQDLLRAHGDLEPYIRGVIAAVDYFSNSPDSVCEALPTGEFTYYDLLLEALACSGIADTHAQALERTLAFIDEHVEPDVRHLRSSVLSKLGRRTTSPRFRAIWHTVVHAWNAAVQRSVSNGGSVGYLPGGAPVGPLVDDTIAMLMPAPVLRHERLGEVRLLGATNADPTRLGWPRILQLAGETEATRRVLQEMSYASLPDDATAALERHVAKVRDVLAPWQLPKTKEILIGIVGAGVFAWGQLPQWLGAAAGMVLNLARVLERRYLIASTLHRAGTRTPFEDSG